jgi:amino acid adenylation domain-containing protein
MTLPDYMIPARFSVLPLLPLSPNGKTDRRALEALDAEWLAGGSEAPVAARSETERKLVAVWEDVLRHEVIGIHDDFLALGGHSLLVMRMLPLLAEAVGRPVPLRWVFEERTVARLAERIEGSAASETEYPIMPADRTRPLVASSGQRGMWLAHAAAPDPSVCNVVVSYRISGPVDSERLRASLKKLSARHETLRTSFRIEGDNLRLQIVDANTDEIPLVIHDLRSEPEISRTSIAATVAEQAASAGFDLGRAPLWTIKWIVTSDACHSMVACFHHSIVDEWSLRQMLSDWEKTYNGEELPGLEVQYADYAAWEKLRLAGPAREQWCHWWRQDLLHPPSSLMLPCDRVELIPRTGRGGIVRFEVPARTAAKLRMIAKGEGASLFATVLCAWQTYLSRCGGQPDLIVATPFSRRGHPDLSKVAGYFLNTLPVRVQIDHEAGFRAVLCRVREKVLQVMDHSSLPFEEIAVLAREEGGHESLHRIMFVLLETGMPVWRIGSAEGIPVEPDSGTCICDLLLSVQVDDGPWRCQLNYAADLFSSETAAGIAAQFTELLRAIEADPDQPVGCLNLLTAEQRERQDRWNDTMRPYPIDRRVHELFEDQVLRSPDAEALVTESEVITYEQLNRRANVLARALMKCGASRGAAIALCMERSADAITGYLAVLKTGAICLPLEPGDPEERRNYMLRDAAVDILITHSSWTDRFAASAATVIAADAGTGCEDISNPDAEGSAEDAAAVMYTSGSTGRPKGVLVPHRGIVRLVVNPDYVKLGPEETLMHAAPLGFDASTFEIWGGLLNGGRVVLMPPGLFSLSLIGDMIRRYGVTTAWLTAGLFHQVIEERVMDLKPLRQLLAGGDALLPGLVRKALDSLPECRIINGYGPTESCTFACCHDVRYEWDRQGSVPIGRPIGNTRVYVVDRGLNQLPPGVIGELLIGGDGLACGYLQRPELTAERFISDPFSGDPAARLYRTGDMVRWRTDGVLEFIGRKDGQVKIREPASNSAISKRHSRRILQLRPVPWS